MAMPQRIGGPDDEAEKPGLVIKLGLKKPKMPSRIGGPDEGEEEGPSESVSHDEALNDAAAELVSELQKMKPSTARVAAALKAAFYACDAEPHDEGEHTEEEGDE